MAFPLWLKSTDPVITLKPSLQLPVVPKAPHPPLLPVLATSCCLPPSQHILFLGWRQPARRLSICRWSPRGQHLPGPCLHPQGLLALSPTSEDGSPTGVTPSTPFLPREAIGQRRQPEATAHGPSAQAGRSRGMTWSVTLSRQRRTFCAYAQISTCLSTWRMVLIEEGLGDFHVAVTHVSYCSAQGLGGQLCQKAVPSRGLQQTLQAFGSGHGEAQPGRVSSHWSLRTLRPFSCFHLPSPPPAAQGRKANTPYTGRGALGALREQPDLLPVEMPKVPSGASLAQHPPHQTLPTIAVCPGALLPHGQGMAHCSQGVPPSRPHSAMSALVREAGQPRRKARSSRVRPPVQSQHPHVPCGLSLNPSDPQSCIPGDGGNDGAAVQPAVRRI